MERPVDYMGKFCRTAAIFFIIAIFLMGCGSAIPPPAIEQTPQVEQTTEEISSASLPTSFPQDTIIFDPMALGDDNIIAPMELPPVEHKVIVTNPVEPEKILVEKEVPGFRVQIFATNSHEAARQMEQSALFEFSEEVRLTYDPPTYKIRVGNCETRDEANLLRAKAISLGYLDAWVVKDQVKIKTYQ